MITSMKEDFFNAARFIDDSWMRENKLLNNRANEMRCSSQSIINHRFAKFAKIKCKCSSSDDNLTNAENGI